MDEADEKDNELKEKLYKLFFQWGDMFLKGDANAEEAKAIDEGENTEGAEKKNLLQEKQKREKLAEE